MDNIIGAVAALATVLAVVTALFKEWFITRLWSPKVHLENDMLFLSVILADGKTEARCYARLAVTAQKKRPAPEDLRIYVLNCRPPAKVGEKGGVRDRFHIPLGWSYSKADAATLSPGVPRYVDLAVVKGKELAFGRLCTMPRPEEGYRLEAGTSYTLNLAAAAKNMSVQCWRLKLSLRKELSNTQDSLISAFVIRGPQKVSSTDALRVNARSRDAEHR